MTTETQALAVIDQQIAATLRSDAPLGQEDKGRLMGMAKYLVANNLAPKNDTPEAVVAKFMAGRELGLAPMQAMVDLYVVNGQVMGDTRIMASQLRAGGWDFWYEGTNTEQATVVLLDPKGREHRLTVTYDECHEAGWDQSYGKVKPTWQGGGRAIMLRYRALSQAIRAFAADTLNLRVDKANVQRLGGENAPNDAAVIRAMVQRLGVTATMGLVLTAANAGVEGDVLPSTFDSAGSAASASPAPSDAAAAPLDADFADLDAAPWEEQEQQPAAYRTPEQVRTAIQARATAEQGHDLLAAQSRQGLVAGTLEQLFPNGADRASRQAARHALLDYLLGKPSVKTLTTGECTALLEWAQERTPEGEWLISDLAIAEADLILQAAGHDHGQRELF